jgi:hypothetical protein
MRATSLAVALLAFGAGSLHGQAPATAATPAAVAPAAAAPAAPAARADSAAEPKLIFDREVYSYPAGPRRDPFTPLVGENDAGPRFEDLELRGIIYSPAGNSLIVVAAGGKVYRAHRGEMVGNSRVVSISPTRVVFSVDNFGVWRQQSLELKKNPEGAKG